MTISKYDFLISDICYLDQLELPDNAKERSIKLKSCFELVKEYQHDQKGQIRLTSGPIPDKSLQKPQQLSNLIGIEFYFC